MKMEGRGILDREAVEGRVVKGGLDGKEMKRGWRKSDVDGWKDKG